MKALVFVAASVLMFTVSSVPARTWTNDEGVTLEADLLRIKGRTAILRSGGSKEVTAPIARLSQADQAWVERYKQLTEPRVWGVPGEGTRRGQFLNVVQGNVRLKQGSSTAEVPFEDLTAEGWMLVYEAYQLYEKPPAADFLEAKPDSLAPRADGVDPLTAPLRDWTDVKGRAIRAAYLGAEGRNVLLFLKAKEVAVPLARLSEADQRWVAQQKVAGFQIDLQSAVAGLAQAAARVGKNRELQRQLAPPPPPKPDPTAVAATASPVQQPSALQPVAPPAGPTLNHIKQLSDAEQRQRLQDAFGDLAALEETYVGASTCDHCKGYFVFPDGYGIGDPCPYCTAKVQDVASLTAYRSSAPAAGGSAGSAPGPWYGSGLARGLIAVAVVAVLGVVTKVAMSGGGEDDEADEDDE